MGELTQVKLKELLHYDSETGVFTWRARTSNRITVGDVAGSVGPNGYRLIGIDGKRYYAHRLAWMCVQGSWPEFQIDHFNGARDDNRINNLRVAKSDAEQHQNQGLYSNNKSGFPGVCLHTRTKKWRAEISAYCKKHYLGLFNTPEEAAEAYHKAKRKYHKFNPEVREFSHKRAGACL